MDLDVFLREKGAIMILAESKKTTSVLILIYCPHKKRQIRVHRNSYIITKEKKKMSSLRQELSNKYSRKKIEMNFAKVILENLNLPARHMLISILSPGVTCIQVPLSLALPPPLSLRLLGLASDCLFVLAPFLFQIFKEIKSMRPQQPTHLVPQVKARETGEVTQFAYL